MGAGGLAGGPISGTELFFLIFIPFALLLIGYIVCTLDFARQKRNISPINKFKGTLYKLGIKRHQIKRNQPCPCGSGVKYKKCCHLIE